MNGESRRQNDTIESYAEYARAVKKAQFNRGNAETNEKNMISKSHGSSSFVLSNLTCLRYINDTNNH